MEYFLLDDRVLTDCNMIKEYNLMMYFVACFISIANSNGIHHIVPDDDGNTNNSTHTLQYYHYYVRQ